MNLIVLTLDNSKTVAYLPLPFDVYHCIHR